MGNQSVEILQMGPYPEWDQGPLDAAFTMHRYFEAADKAAFLDQVGDDLADHRYGGQCDNNPCAPFVAGMIPSEEDMRVAPVLNRL